MFYRVVVIAIMSMSYEDVKARNLTTIWTYDDETSWPGLRCRDGGKRQSPIDIRTEEVKVDFESEFIRYGKLNFKGYRGVLMTGVNNGLTVQFSTDGDPMIHPTISGGPLKHTYRLEQLHFHWLSEHAVDGRKYPMEIHFVHVRSDLPVSDALNRKDGLAIIAMFCNVEATLNENVEQALGEIMDVVPLLLKTGNRVSGLLLDLMTVMAPGMTSYYAYQGSLTSPECNEAVIWIIYEKPLSISDAQYRLFGKIGVSRHNFRSLQPLRHHIVFRSRPTQLWVAPNFYNAVSAFFADVKQFFQNVTRYAITQVKGSYHACRNFTRDNKKYGFVEG